MVIAWDRGMFWHIDCEKDSHGGIMKEVRVDEAGGLIECLSCGKKGHYPKGHSGRLCVPEQAAGG